uniref:G_PROTEIN_RECEP_F1_2 domain-containing protein n=1 Tax=Heterorhabditis bacteriophora TaxID=37862 RepID=A0A1I7WZ49_HETBA
MMVMSRPEHIRYSWESHLMIQMQRLIFLGFPAIVYIALNRTIQKDVLKLIRFRQARSMNSVQATTDIKGGVAKLLTGYIIPLIGLGTYKITGDLVGIYVWFKRNLYLAKRRIVFLFSDILKLKVFSYTNLLIKKIIRSVTSWFSGIILLYFKDMPCFLFIGKFIVKLYIYIYTFINFGIVKLSSQN